MLAPTPREQRRFQLILIKPSHYDADGYVIQWVRSSIPSNSLACVYALAMDAAARNVLGDDIAIDISATDETNTRVKVKDIVAQLKRHDNFGMVGLVGVQSNQFPRVPTQSITRRVSAFETCQLRWRSCCEIFNSR